MHFFEGKKTLFILKHQTYISCKAQFRNKYSILRHGQPHSFGSNKCNNLMSIIIRILYHLEFSVGDIYPEKNFHSCADLLGGNSPIDITVNMEFHFLLPIVVHP